MLSAASFSLYVPYMAAVDDTLYVLLASYVFHASARGLRTRPPGERT